MEVMLEIIMLKLNYLLQLKMDIIFVRLVLENVVIGMKGRQLLLLFF